jgi:hypothetical protein
MGATTDPTHKEPRSGAAAVWTTGVAVAVSVLLMINGSFQFVEGLAAVLRGDFFVVADSYAFQANVTVWGWIHLVIGAGLFGLGVALLSGSTAARYTAIALAGLSALANFLFIPYQPIWSVIIVALDVAVIWALAGYEPRRR